ncbi:MAG: chorismate mutase [Sphingomicrobium sp.]
MIDIPEPAECTTMAEVRAGVDDVDARLVALIARRFGYMDAAARIKAQRTAVRDETRKAQVLEHIGDEADKAGIDRVALMRMWDDLIEASIAHEMRAFDKLHG